MREGFVFSFDLSFFFFAFTTLLFLSVLSISSMHAAPGLLSWSMELLLAFASRQFSPKIVDMCVRFIRVWLILPCEPA